MAKPVVPRFLKRKGHDLTVKDAEGRKRHATLTPIDKGSAKSSDKGSDRHGTHDEGAFAFGYCKSCDWTGPARRAREKARKDAVAHQDDCSSKGKIRIGVSDKDLS